MLVDILNQQCKTDEVHLIILNNKVEYQLLNKLDSRVSVHLCGRPESSKNPYYLLKLNLLILSVNPDIIHCHSEGLIKYVLLPYKKVRTIHSTLCSGTDYHHYKKLFCISKGVKSFTEKQGFSNTELVYNGIDMSVIDQKSDFKKKDFVRFINIGRFQKVKGQWLLIEAIKILKEKNKRLNFHVDFIGEGNTLQECKDLVSKYGLNDYVTFLGLQPRDYFYPRMRSYDCYIQPSISEGFGLTIAEALSAKLPVITSDLDGPMEVIDFGKYGIPFASGNAEQLAEKMDVFIENGPDERMVNAGFDFVLENFCIERTAKKYIEEYKKVIR